MSCRHLPQGRQSSGTTRATIAMVRCSVRGCDDDGDISGAATVAAEVAAVAATSSAATKARRTRRRQRPPTRSSSGTAAPSSLVGVASDVVAVADVDATIWWPTMTTTPAAVAATRLRRTGVRRRAVTTLDCLFGASK